MAIESYGNAGCGQDVLVITALRRGRSKLQSQQIWLQRYVVNDHLRDYVAQIEPNPISHQDVTTDIVLLVLVWYLDHHDLLVTPINPSSSTITFSPQSELPSISTVSSTRELENASETALSIITPPAVTRQVLTEAHEAGIRAVWMQPGSFDEESLAFAQKTWPRATIAGFDEDEDGFGTKGNEGWCVLVDGEAGLKLVRQQSEKL